MRSLVMPLASAFCGLIMGAGAMAGPGEELQAQAVVVNVRAIAQDIDRSGGTATDLTARLRDQFDFTTIGRAVLAGAWNAAGAEERTEFTNVLADLTVRNVVQRLGSARAQAFEVTGARTLRAEEVLVESRLTVPVGRTVALDWRLHRSGHRFHIVDISVDGRSVSVTRRDEYAAQLAANGSSVAALTDTLRRGLLGPAALELDR